MKQYTLEEKIFRAVSAVEVENVMAHHCYFHAASHHRDEFEQLWTRERPDGSWLLAMGKMTTTESFYQAYVTGSEAMSAANYEALVKVYPEVEGMDRRGLIEHSIHMLASPLMEIAADGQSMKCIWYTPGAIFSTINPSGKKEGLWTWERYAADFIYENGRWVFLTLEALCDFVGPMDTANWSAIQEEASNQLLPGVEAEDGTMVTPPMDEFGAFHQGYTPWQIPQTVPPLPEPYETYDKTFRY